MKTKIFIIAAFVLFLFGCSTEKRVNSTVRHYNSIVILYENDVHCAIDGYAKMAGLRDAISDTAYVCMVSSGDYLQGGTAGAISNGGYIVEIMKPMHYDAISLGNHEFDYGMPRQLELLSTFNAPVLCANLYDKDGKCVYSPYKIFNYGGRKVAFVGVVTAEAEAITPACFAKGVYTLNKDNMAKLVQQSVDEARTKGCEYVIVLSHLGEEYLETSITSHELVAATTGIDVVLDAHSHSVVVCDTLMNADNQPVYVSQTGTAFANVGELVIAKNGIFRFNLIPTNDIPYVNAEVAKVTDSIRALVDAAVGQVVFHSDYKLRINDENGKRVVRKAETNSGDLVADAMRCQLDADVAFINGGGIRKEIEPGDVTYKKVVDMLPFDNKVVKIEATGAKIIEMLRRTVQEVPNESGDFPQASNVRYTIHVVENGENYVTDIDVMQPDGSYKPIDTNAKYTVAVNDYCAYNGGFKNVFAECTVLYEPMICYRDVVTEYVVKVLKGEIPPRYEKSQGRITIIFE